MKVVTSAEEAITFAVTKKVEGSFQFSDFVLNFARILILMSEI